MTEDEMVGWHHRLNGCGFGWTEGFDMKWEILMHPSAFDEKSENMSF